MFGLLRPGHRSGSPVPVRIGPGGLVPVLVLAAFFAVLGAEIGVPIATAALLGAVGGTTSLLFHEFGHVRAARGAAGIRSAAVSLFWLGAATRFEGTYRQGREQTKVAIAGPLASFVLGFSLAAMSLLPMPPQIRGSVLLLAFFNLTLGVFNLLPVYPFDGYKVVVGLLWAATGSETRARRILRRVGIGWAAVEVPAAAVLVVERPNVGLVAAPLAAVVLGQRWFAARRFHALKLSR
jgi:Zn-dependent protease